MGASGSPRAPGDIPEEDRDYYLERKYPAFGNLSPRDISSRSAKEVCDDGRGVGATGYGVYLDFRDAIERLGKDVIAARYGNLFDMYERITGDNPYAVPMRIYPASHYTMGGLWVDYHLMSTIEGLFVLGEANFSDHGANRLGASALMQGLADGYFVIPDTMGNYLGGTKIPPVDTDRPEFGEVEEQVRDKAKRLLAIDGKRSADSFHRELGRVMWESCGMGRNEAGLKKAIEKIPEIRSEFWQNLKTTGTGEELNVVLESAGRVADFLEFGELICRDALARDESCGAHFREEHQSEEGEAVRNDEEYCHVSAWEHKGDDEPPEMHKEPLVFESVTLTTRSYK
jgi:succinate dehydrogenase / fumarate reductase flavoprotein subunit